MQVIFLVGETVMMPVMGGPPEHALLRRSHGHECDDELENAAGFIRSVREIAVIPGGDPEHAYGDERDASDQIRPLEWHEENTKGQQVDDREGCYSEDRNMGAVRQRYRPSS